MNTYNKAPLTYTEQIELLKSRGLIFLTKDEPKGILPISVTTASALICYHTNKVKME